MTTQPLRPVLRTQADVSNFWNEICRPLGWARYDLWFVMVDADGRPLPIVQDIRDRPPEVDPEIVHGLVKVWLRLRDEVVPGGSIAVLLCRPGPNAVETADRDWARAIAAAAASAGVRLEVVHVAGDVAITPLPLDEIA